MEQFKLGWILARRDFTNNRMIFVWSTIFILYMAGVFGLIFYSGSGDVSVMGSGSIDFIMLICAPLLGTDFSRRAFHLMQNDAYTQNLLYLRTLPIPSSAIIWGRIQQMAIIFFYNWTLFFIMLYLIRIQFDDTVSFVAYLSFAITWAGIGLSLMSLYLHFEFSQTGKKYIRSSFIIVITLVILAVMSAWLNWDITSTLLQFSIQYGLASVIMWGSIILSVVAISLAIRAIKHTLQHRDLV